MSLRTQNLLSLVALAIALTIGSCETLRIGASTRLEPPSADACCASESAG